MNNGHVNASAFQENQSNLFLSEQYQEKNDNYFNSWGNKKNVNKIFNGLLPEQWSKCYYLTCEYRCNSNTDYYDLLWHSVKNMGTIQLHLHFSTKIDFSFQFAFELWHSVKGANAKMKHYYSLIMDN